MRTLNFRVRLQLYQAMDLVQVLESNKTSSEIESSSLEDYVGKVYGTDTKGLWAKSKRLKRIDIE